MRIKYDHTSVRVGCLLRPSTVWVVRDLGLDVTTVRAGVSLGLRIASLRRGEPVRDAGRVNSIHSLRTKLTFQARHIHMPGTVGQQHVMWPEGVYLICSPVTGSTFEARRAECTVCEQEGYIVPGTLV